MKHLLFFLMLFPSLLWAQPHNNLKIVFVGDMMLDELPGQYLKKGKDPLANFRTLFNSADITIGNLECAIGIDGKREDKPFTFQAHPRVIPFLKKTLLPFLWLITTQWISEIKSLKKCWTCLKKIKFLFSEGVKI